MLGDSIFSYSIFVITVYDKNKNDEARINPQLTFTLIVQYVLWSDSVLSHCDDGDCTQDRRLYSQL